MTFDTPPFLIFFAVVFGAYWLMGRRAQNLLLLAASAFFYGWWDWRFLFLLLAIAGSDFLIARRLEREDAPRRRKMLLGVSLATNLGALAYFKYADFFIESFQGLLASAGWHADPFALRLILPLGISFYTFQALSYTIDVYRRQIPATSDPVQYFAFILFFPQLVAGPIERAAHLLPQFQRSRVFAEPDAADGARQMLWGFFKKMVVADNLALIVNPAFASPESVSGWQLLWATYAFALQIYCDFSGYTDIAIGCAKLFGFRLTRNFAYPYFSTDIVEFWRRWHISLSSWFRDYVYIPLGGSRVSPGRRYLNVMLTFTVSGFWHGANWTFGAWGLLHGGLQSVTMALRSRGWMVHDEARSRHWLPTWREALGIAVTFNLVCLGWILFRAPSIESAGLIMSRIGYAMVAEPFETPAGAGHWMWALVMIGFEWLRRMYPHALAIGDWPRPVRWVSYYAVTLCILWAAQLAYVPFIYFQF